MCWLHWPKHRPPGITGTELSRLLHPLAAPGQNPGTQHQLRPCIATTPDTVTAVWKHHFFISLSSFQTAWPGLRRLCQTGGCGGTRWTCTGEMHQQKVPSRHSLSLLKGHNVHSHAAWVTAFVSPAHCIPWQDKLIKRIYFLKSLL